MLFFEACPFKSTKSHLHKVLPLLFAFWCTATGAAQTQCSLYTASLLWSHQGAVGGRIIILFPLPFSQSAQQELWSLFVFSFESTPMPCRIKHRKGIKPSSAYHVPGNLHWTCVSQPHQPHLLFVEGLLCARDLSRTFLHVTLGSHGSSVTVSAKAPCLLKAVAWT